MNGYDNTLEEAKENVSVLEYIRKHHSINKEKLGRSSKGPYIRIDPCPICGHKGHFDVYYETNSFCERKDGSQIGGTIIDFLQMTEGLSLESAISKTKELAGLNTYSNKDDISNNARGNNTKQELEENVNWLEIIDEMHSNLSSTDYFKSRGFSDKLINKYKLGYHEKGLFYILNKYKNRNPKFFAESLKGNSKELWEQFKYFIPIFNQSGEVKSFITRRDDSLQLPKWVNKDPKKMKVHNLKDRPIALLNERYLYDTSLTGKFIFIVEGWADALTIEEIGYHSIALNSVYNVGLFIEKLEKNKDLLQEKIFICTGDNDDSGQTLNSKLKQGFKKLNVKFDTFIIPQTKDLNDWFVSNSKDLNVTISKFLVDLDTKNLNKNSEPIGKDTPKNETGLIYFNFSDVGNAERLFHSYGELIKFSYDRNKWYIWTGKRWGLDKTGTVDRMAKKVLRNLQEDVNQLSDFDEYEKALKKQAKSFVIRSENDSRIKAMINQTKSQSGVAIKEDKLDKNIYTLNCNDGILDLKTGELNPHNKEALITKIAPVEYKKGAECPEWLKFLDRIFMGDSELIEYIQRTVGYSLTGDISQQCFYMLYGGGANGKSTFLNTIKHIMGDYSDSLKGSSLMTRKNDEGARGDLAKLKGARFVWASELNDGQTFDESLVKSLTGGDPIPVRFLYGEEFDLISQFKLWIGTNEKPNIKGSNHGIWRRVRLIPFEYTIPDNEKNDLFFEEVLLPEISGILNWAIEGCIKWQKYGITVPKKVKVAVDEYKNEMDILQNFIDDCCIIATDKRADTKSLYSTYTEWCNSTGEKVMTQTMFGKKMTDKGFKKGRTAYMRYYDGIGILSNRCEDDDLVRVNDNVYPFKK